VTLRWKSFERTTRRRVAEAVRRSDSLRQEYKLARQAVRARQNLRPWVMQIFWRCIFPLLVLTNPQFSQTTTSGFIIAIILVLTLGMMFFRGGQLQNELYLSSTLQVLGFLPISNHDLFTVQWRRFLRRSLWSVLDFTLCYSALLLSSHVGRVNAVAAGVGLGLIQWLFISAVAVCLFAFGPRKYLTVIGLPLVGSAFALFCFGLRQPLLSQWSSHFAWMVPPLGWILRALGISASRGPLLDLVPGLIAACLLALTPFACQRVRREFEQSESSLRGEERAQALQEFGEQFKHTTAQAEAVIASRKFLDGFDWQHARFVERSAASLLNSRERVIAEFMVASNPVWTAQLRRLLIIVFLAAVLGWMMAAGLRSAGGLLMLLAFYFMVASFLCRWRGYASPTGGGLQSPFYAVYPIGFGELMRVVLKINLARFVISVPFVLGALFILTKNPLLAQSHILEIGLKLIALGLMIQPIRAFAPISRGTNDTQKLGHAVSAILLIIGWIASAITFVMAWNPVLALPAGVATAGLSVLSLFLYGRWFNRSQIDLVPLDKMEPSQAG
jgi:hypothetical protein